MYNPQLDTFFVVAEAGSFTKAAKQLFITPSAVLQQINSLEKNLEVTLFIRSKSGIALTDAGTYLLGQTKHVMQWNSSIRSALKQLDKHGDGVLRVGVPKMHKSTAFYELWTKYSASHHDARIDFIEASASQGPDIAATYSSVDLIEFVKMPFTWQDDLSFLKLGDTPMLFGVPMQHPYHDMEIIKSEQLRAQRLIVCEGPFAVALHDYLEKLKKFKVEIQYVPAYTHSVIDKAVFDKTLILLPACSKNIHPGIKALHCELEESLPYGFFYSPAADAGSDSFIKFVRQQIDEGEFIWEE